MCHQNLGEGVCTYTRVMCAIIRQSPSHTKMMTEAIPGSAREMISVRTKSPAARRECISGGGVRTTSLVKGGNSDTPDVCVCVWY